MARSVTLNLNLKMGSTSAFKDAVVSLTKEMQAQQQSAVKLQAALDPAFIKDRVRLTNEIGEAQANLNAALEKEQDLQGRVALKGKTEADRKLAALRSVNESLEQQHQQLANIAALSDPKSIQKRVALQLQTEHAQKNAAFAESKERARQLGPTKAIGDLFNFPDLTKKFAQWGGSLSGIGESMGGKWGGRLKRFGDFVGGTPAANAAANKQSPAAPAAKPALPLPALNTGAGAEIAGAAGGGAGLAAAAGPIGVAIGAAVALTPVVKSLASAPFATVTAGMATVNKALSGMTGPLGAVGSALGVVEGVGSGMKSLGDKLGPLGIGLSVMGGAIEGVTQQVTAFLNTAVHLAQKANPATVQRLGFAIDDAAAVIGHRMLPVVELLTDAVRGIGDVLNTILPSTAEFRSALSPIGDAIEEIRQDVAPFAHLMKAIFTEGLYQAGLGLRIFWETVKPLFKLASFILPGGPGGDLDSSQGAAARGGQFQSYEDYAKTAYASALSSGGVDPSRETAKNTGTLPQILEVLRERLGLPGSGDRAQESLLEGILRGMRGW